MVDALDNLIARPGVQFAQPFYDLVALLLTLLFSVIGSFQLFNEPKLLKTIAPNVIDSGYTANLYASAAWPFSSIE